MGSTPTWIAASFQRRLATATIASLSTSRELIPGREPDAEAVAQYAEDVVAELQSWGFIGDAEVVGSTWIDVAYTWSWPNSRWKSEALRALEEQEVLMVGRYARWLFQGIADSIRDGLFAGAAHRRAPAAEGSEILDERLEGMRPG